MEVDQPAGEQAGEAKAEAVTLQQRFTADVHRFHAELVGRGVCPNAACALALRAAAGQAPLPPSLGELFITLQAAKHSGDWGDACAALRTFVSSPDAWHAAFWPAPGQRPAAAEPRPSAKRRRQEARPCEPWLAIDHDAVAQLQQQLQGCQDERLHAALAQGSQLLLLHISDAWRCGSANPGFCRQVCGLLANPWLEHLEGHDLLAAIAGVLVEVASQRHALLGGRAAGPPADGAPPLGQQLQRLFRSFGAREMRRAVGLLHNYITLTLYGQQAITRGVEAATELLGLLQEANAATQVLDLADFYNDAVNEPDFNVKEDYRRWTNASPSAPLAQRPFSFCGHAWIYDPAAKTRILQLENQMQQLQAFESSMMQAMLGGSGCPFLLLRVRRGPYLLQDTLLQINAAKNNGSLKKPLKVKFIGEEGVDEGGLQKEFFQLLVRQCFNPEFGMFTYGAETRLHWFHASSMDLDTEFELIGILIGLAIYNSHILEFSFPLVLYKKLLDQPIGLDDLAELQPAIHRSLNQLLEMGEDELQALGLSFQVETAGGFGELAAVDLRPGGAGVAVTTANVAEYTEAYAQHLLTRSISRQFGAFKRGFLRLCSGEALGFFRPSELELLVCGSRVVDLSALEAATSYDDGYHASSQPVLWFWQVVHSLDAEQQKRLLFFITGSDRVPIKGLGHLSPPFVISRNGSDAARLPSAHTCFNHLLLPAYGDIETLRNRLLLAIENAEGFGLT